MPPNESIIKEQNSIDFAGIINDLIINNMVDVEDGEEFVTKVAGTSHYKNTVTVSLPDGKEFEITVNQK